MEKEIRCFKTEVRATKNESGGDVVRGYALKFNKMSQNLGGFREVIAPGAADGILTDDVRALLNHDNNLILGRTKSGTARIGVDDTGLWYEYDSPDTSYARDLLVSLERGDVDQSSFQFTVARDGDEWDENEEGVIVRTIKKINRLYDVSPVTFPAYVDTTVSTVTKRSMQDFKEKRKEEQHEEEIPTEEIDTDAPEEPLWSVSADARSRQIRLLKLK